VIVMANLAQIAGLYSFLLVGWDSAAASTLAVTLVGVVWIAIMTAICVIGIELSARTQVGLLSAELITLLLFAIFALVKVASGDAGADAVDFSFSWLNPLEIDSFDALVAGVLVAVFIYWGRADARRAAVAGDLRQVLRRSLRPGELRVRRLLVRARAAARDRHRVPGAGRGLMLLWRAQNPEFFRRKPEVADPALMVKIGEA
jgi:amino acid transporter